MALASINDLIKDKNHRASCLFSKPSRQRQAKPPTHCPSSAAFLDHSRARSHNDRRDAEQHMGRLFSCPHKCLHHPQLRKRGATSASSRSIDKSIFARNESIAPLQTDHSVVPPQLHDKVPLWVHKSAILARGGCSRRSSSALLPPAPGERRPLLACWIAHLRTRYPSPPPTATLSLFLSATGQRR